MSTVFDRRTALRAGLATVAAVGVGVLSSPAGAAQAHSPGADGDRPPMPDVPGMSGNRRANEFFYQYDEVFFFQRPQDIIDAFTEIGAVLGSVEGSFYGLWRQHRDAGTYPTSYRDAVLPVKEPLAYISNRELEVFDSFYRHNNNALANAFADFGQGVLFDPRRPAGQMVHMMNYNGTNPPVNYHLWHAILQARILLGIDARRWREIDPMVGLGWAAQSLAKPARDVINPGLDRRVVANLKRTWLPRNSRQLDVAFDSFPYPSDVG